MRSSSMERNVNLTLALAAVAVVSMVCAVATLRSVPVAPTMLVDRDQFFGGNAAQRFHSAQQLKAHFASPTQLVDADAVPDILDKARALTSESTQSHALAKIAAAQAEGEEKLLALKKKMLGFMTERAKDLREKADMAQEKVDDAQKRLDSLQGMVQTLRRQAHFESVEAEQRQTLADKLFDQAKNLGLEARAAQKTQFFAQYGTADGPPPVSDKALALLKEEAVRIASVLHEDAANYRSLRQQAAAAAAAAANPAAA